MTKWKLHVPDGSNRITQYKCGLVSGQRVRLKKELVVRYTNGKPTGEVHPIGEEWEVLQGITTDPVLWFREPDGKRCTWDDDANSVDEWFAWVEVTHE